MSDAAQQEYVAALAAYRAAQARLVEAKKHLPETARDRRKRLKREAEARARTDLVQRAGASITEWSSDYFEEYIRKYMWPDIDALLAKQASSEGEG